MIAVTRSRSTRPSATPEPPSARKPVAARVPDTATDSWGGSVLRSVRIVGTLLISFQLLAMLVFSTVQYGRFAVSNDFGTYSQAWWAIAHGHFNPWGSLIRTPFWRDNAEFAMWPLALLYFVYPHTVLLLWVQDICVALTGLVAFRWCLDVIDRSRLSHRAGSKLAAGVAIAIVLNPWAYNTIAYDFHVESIFALFVVLAGRDLWAGRYRRLWIWVPLAVFSDVLGAMCILGVGIAGIMAGSKTRRAGVVLAVAGLAWVTLISSIHAAGVAGRIPDTAYAYLANKHGGHIGIVDIVVGSVSHPGAVFHMVSLRWLTVFEFLVTLGLIGCISPWGFGVALVVFVPTILSTDHGFLNLLFSFQSWPALPFVLVGSTMIIVKWVSRGGVWLSTARVSAGLWAAFVAVFAVVALPAVPQAWIPVSGGAAEELASTLHSIPASAEVIASQGIVGRFALRDYVYPYVWTFGAGESTKTYPVKSGRVIFIISARDGTFLIPTREATKAVSYMERLGARLERDRSGVTVLSWAPPPGVTSVTLP